MPTMKSSGTRVLFMLRKRISRLNPTAQRMYSGISELTSCFVSAIIADIPPMKQCSCTVAFICASAFIVEALALESVNFTSSMVAPSSF